MCSLPAVRPRRPGCTARARPRRRGRPRSIRRSLLGTMNADGIARRARHRGYYRDLARRATAERVSARDAEWVLLLQRELPNLRQAMESGLAEAAGADAALEIAVALRDGWFGAGRSEE